MIWKKIESFWLDSFSVYMAIIQNITPSSPPLSPFFAWFYIIFSFLGYVECWWSRQNDDYMYQKRTCVSFVLKRVVSSFYNIFFFIALSSLLLFSCFTKKRLDSSSFIFKVKSSTKNCINNIIKSKRTRMKKHQKSTTQDNNDFQFSPDLASSSVCVYVKMHLSNNSRFAGTVTSLQN